MSNYNLKNVSLTLNLMVLVSEATYISINLYFQEEPRELPRLFIYLGLVVAMYFLNFKIVTPFFLKNGFTLPKLLIHFVSFMLIFLLIICSWGAFVRLILLNQESLSFNFTYWLATFQTGLFIFLISTGTSAISLIEKNQFFIQNLEVENQLNKLKTIQNSTSSELISNYISYLQHKQKEENISNEIIELADFLRQTIYTSSNDLTFLFSELDYLNLYKSILDKSQNLTLNIHSQVHQNVKVLAFGLVTPIKTLVLANPSYDLFEVWIKQDTNCILQTVKYGDTHKEFSIPAN